MNFIAINSRSARIDAESLGQPQNVPSAEIPLAAVGAGQRGRRTNQRPAGGRWPRVSLSVGSGMSGVTSSEAGTQAVPSK